MLFPLSFTINHISIFLLLPQSSIYMTSSQACSYKSNYRKAPLTDDEKRAIFEDIILIMWQALIQTESLTNTRTHRYRHTPAHTATPGSNGSWLSEGKEGRRWCGEQKMTRQSHLTWSCDAFMKPALEIVKIQNTITLRLSHTSDSPRNSFTQFVP